MQQPVNGAMQSPQPTTTAAPPGASHGAAPPPPGFIPPATLLQQHQQVHHQSFLYSQPHPQHYHHLIHQANHNPAAWPAPGAPPPGALPASNGPEGRRSQPPQPDTQGYPYSVAAYPGPYMSQHATGWPTVPTPYHALYGVPAATSYYHHHHQYGPYPFHVPTAGSGGAPWYPPPMPFGGQGGYTVTYVHHAGPAPPGAQSTPSSASDPTLTSSGARQPTGTTGSSGTGGTGEPNQSGGSGSSLQAGPRSTQATSGSRSGDSGERMKVLYGPGSTHPEGPPKGTPPSSSEEMLMYADVLRGAVTEDARVFREYIDVRNVNGLADLLQTKYAQLYRHLEVTAFALTHAEQIERQRRQWEARSIPIPDGIFTAYYLWHRSHAAGTRRELCMKHNGRAKSGEPYGRCLYGDARCKFRHECAFCRLPDHGWFAVGRCTARLRLQDELAALGLVKYRESTSSSSPDDDPDEATVRARAKAKAAHARAHNFQKMEGDLAVAVPVQRPRQGQSDAAAAPQEVEAPQPAADVPSGARETAEAIAVADGSDAAKAEQQTDPPAAVDLARPDVAGQNGKENGVDSGDSSGHGTQSRTLAVRYYTAGVTQQDDERVEAAARMLFGSRRAAGDAAAAPVARRHDADGSKQPQAIQAHGKHAPHSKADGSVLPSDHAAVSAGTSAPTSGNGPASGSQVTPPSQQSSGSGHRNPSSTAATDSGSRSGGATVDTPDAVAP